MSAQETWIARPGELIRAGQAVSELATRVGGLPTYPDGCKPPPAELTTCQVCNKPLALLLQVGGVRHHACRRRLPGSKLQPLAAWRLPTRRFDPLSRHMHRSQRTRWKGASLGASSMSLAAPLRSAAGSQAASVR